MIKANTRSTTRNAAKILTLDISETLFPSQRKLIPNLNDLYELELAFYENQILTDEGVIKNAAYFETVNNEYTHHYLICTGQPVKLPDHSSSRLKSFFQTNLFRTGYATHGLFPYRGKFHPQMIKGLMNVMGLKPGDTVLDPMMGSGTVLVEATLMGINSIGIDASPFCRFMAQTKIDALTMPLERSRKALVNYEEVFSYFQNRVGKPKNGSKDRSRVRQDILLLREPEAGYASKGKMGINDDTAETYNFLLLAYLDSAGYAERSNRKTPIEQFKAILERYVFVADKIQNVIRGIEIELAASKTIEGDARALPLDDSSVDGIIFSPPYSFAIDYLDNDSFHLKYFGVDMDHLRKGMIGLRGKRLEDKVNLYSEDIHHVVSECSRVLRPGCFCTIVVGTNNNQLSKALKISPDEVPGIHEMIIELCAKNNLKLIRTMSRPITGISNTMRKEYILFFRRK